MFIRDELWHYRGSAALALARQRVAATERLGEVKPLLKEALRAANAIEAHGIASLRGWALLLRAGAASVGARGEETIRLMQRAIAAFEAAEMRHYAQTTRYCLGRLLDDANGSAAVSEADAWLRAEGVINVEGFARSLAPGVSF